MKNHRGWMWILFWLCNLSSFAASNPEVVAEYLARTWQIEDGLPDNEVNAILQSHDGYLWVGTGNGLARFDGAHFKVFDARDVPALANNRILELVEDAQGGLWIGTSRGELLRYWQGRFQNINLGNTNRAQVTHLMLDGQNAIWVVAAQDSLIRFTADRIKTLSEATAGATNTTFYGTRMLSAGSQMLGQPRMTNLWEIVLDDAGKIWVISGQNLYNFQSGQWQLATKGSGLTAICPRRGGGVWLADDVKLRSWRVSVGSDERAEFGWYRGTSDAYVKVLGDDQAGTLWAGTHGNGLLRLDSQGRWSHVVTEGPLFQGFVACIYEDQEGSLWVGCENGGLTRLKRRLVNTVRLPPTARDAYAVTISSASDGSMWIGTVGAGVFRWRAGQFEHFGEAQGITAWHVEVVLEDAHTNIWVGGNGGLFNNATGKFLRVQGLGERAQWVSALFEDSEQRLWVGTHGGLASLGNGQTNWYSREQGLIHPQIRAIAEGTKGQIWVATAFGWLYCLEHGQLRHYGKADGLESDLLVGLLAETNGVVWIAAYDKGIIRYQNGRFTTIGSREGLAANTVSHLLENPQGVLWLASERGLMRLQKKELDRYQEGQEEWLSCLLLTEADGMFSRFCSGGTQPAMARDAAGCLWVPNMKAVAVVDPQGLLPLPAKSGKLSVESLDVNGQSYPLPVNGPLRLPTGKTQIEIHYAFPNLSAPENLRFRYKLEGWDRDWIDAGNARTARYMGLPAGKYRFLCRVLGRDGEWCSAETPLLLNVVPPIWQSRWFQSAAGLGVAGLVGSLALLAARRRARAELVRLEREHALERERARIARDIHDELGAGLAQIGLLADLGVGNPDDAREVQRNFTDIAQRSRSTVAALDEIVWAINPSNDNLPRLADYLCRLAEECFERSTIRCHKELPAQLPVVVIHAEARHHLTLAVKEALANTLKHSRATEVWLRLDWTAPELALEVKDNGCGFEPTQVAGDGNGLRNQQDRLRRIGGELVLKSAPGQGTSISFRLKLDASGACPK